MAVMMAGADNNQWDAAAGAAKNGGRGGGRSRAVAAVAAAMAVAAAAAEVWWQWWWQQGWWRGQTTINKMQQREQQKQWSWRQREQSGSSCSGGGGCDSGSGWSVVAMVAVAGMRAGSDINQQKQQQEQQKRRSLQQVSIYYECMLTFLKYWSLKKTSQKWVGLNDSSILSQPHLRSEICSPKVDTSINFYFLVEHHTSLNCSKVGIHPWPHNLAQSSGILTIRLKVLTSSGEVHTLPICTRVNTRKRFHICIGGCFSIIRGLFLHRSV